MNPTTTPTPPRTTAPSSSPSQSQSTSAELLIPFNVCFYVALSMFLFAAISYACLAYGRKKVELQKEEDKMRLNRMAQHRGENNKNGDNWRARPDDCMIAKSMSAMDQWMYENAKELQSFISNALVFFAIPNLFLLAIMQNNFDRAFFVMGSFAFVLSIAIFGGILYYSRFGSPSDEMCGKHFKAENKYEHLTLPLIDVVVMATGQLTLLALYYWSLKANGDPKFYKYESYLYYYLGVVMQVAYGHDKKIWKGIKHHCLFWIAALRARKKNVIFYSPEDSASVTYSLRDDHFVYVRFILSSLVNTFGCFIIMMGIPLQVATQENPMDFVLNVVAGFYIIEWDDLDDGNTEDFLTQMVDRGSVVDQSRSRRSSMTRISIASHWADVSSTSLGLEESRKKRDMRGNRRSKRDIMEDDIRVLQSQVDALDVLKEQIAKLAVRVTEFDKSNEESEIDLVEFQDCESGLEDPLEEDPLEEDPLEEDMESPSERKVQFNLSS